MARCPDCNRFVGIEMSDPEIDSSEVNDNTIEGTVHLTKTCSECSMELAEAYPEFEIDIQEHVPEGEKDGEHDMQEDCEWSIESEEAENSEKSEGSGRYMKMFYGATLTFEVKCSCGHEATVEGEVYEQASYFDDLV